MVTMPHFGRAQRCVFLCTWFLLLLAACTQQQDGPQDAARSGEATVDTVAGGSGPDGGTGDAETPASNMVSATDTAGARRVDITVDSLTMAYNVRTGDAFSYKVTQVNQANTDDRRLRESTTYYYTKRISKVLPDSLITFSIRFDRIDMSRTLPVMDSTGKTVYQTVMYSSADSTDKRNPAFAHFNALIGHTATMVITPRGDIVDITNVKPVAEKIARLRKDSLSAAEQEFLEREIAVNAYAMVHIQEFQVYPKQPIGAKRTWTATHQAPLAGIFPTENIVTYHLDNIIDMRGREVAEITATLDSRITKKKLTNSFGVAELKSGGMTGGSRHLVDIEKGFTIFKKYNLTVDVVMSATESKSKQTTTSKQQTTSDITVELL